MADLVLGIDVGTTRVKAGAVDRDGRLVSLASRPTPWQGTDEGPVLDVVALGDLVLAVAEEAAAHPDAAGARIAGVATTGMAETGALLGPDDRPLAPGFAWHHTLGDADRVQAALGPETFARTTGHGCDLAPSIIKLDYLRERGHTFAPGQVWLNIPEYVSYRLSGVRACEPSLSGRTGLFDLGAHAWWDDALAFLGAGRWLVPGDPVPAGTSIGPVRRDVSSRLAGAAVTTAGHDHPVAAIASGGAEPGTLSMSLGTSEAHVRVVGPNLSPDDVLRVVRLGATVDWHPLGDRWYVLSTLPTNLTLERLARLMGCADTAARLELSRAALDAPAGNVRLVDATLDSFSLVGITDADTRESTWAGVMRTLVEQSRAHLDALSAVVGTPDTIRRFGGWSHDPLMRRLRDELTPSTSSTDHQEPGIVGASILAWRAAEGVTAGPSA